MSNEFRKLFVGAFWIGNSSGGIVHMCGVHTGLYAHLLAEVCSLAVLRAAPILVLPFAGFTGVDSDREVDYHTLWVVSSNS